MKKKSFYSIDSNKLAYHNAALMTKKKSFITWQQRSSLFRRSVSEEAKKFYDIDSNTLAYFATESVMKKKFL